MSAWDEEIAIIRREMHLLELHGADPMEQALAVATIQQAAHMMGVIAANRGLPQACARITHQNGRLRDEYRVSAAIDDLLAEPTEAEVEAARLELLRHRAGSSPRPDLTSACDCGAIQPATAEGWMEQARHSVRAALRAAREVRA